MFQRILVPLDGSARAERAIDVAARIARAAKGEVLLLRVVGDPAGELAVRTATRTAVSALQGATAVDERTEQAEAVDEAVAAAYLRAVGKRLDAESVPYNTDVLTGQPAQGIVESVERHREDLIVMCSHGWTGLTHWALGGTAERVVRATETPVLVLHEGGPLAAGHKRDGHHVTRVLVSYDGSAVADAVIPSAVQLAAALSEAGPAELCLFRVMNVAYPGNSMGARPEIAESGAGREMRAARDQLEERAERLSREIAGRWDLTVTTGITAQVDVAAAIVAMAETGKPGGRLPAHNRHVADPAFDVIALGAYGERSLRQAALGYTMGSIAGRVIYGTRLPVFVVRPAAPLR